MNKARMERNRESRRGSSSSSMVVSTNGSLRRRHKSTSFRDSPEEDRPVELQESVRLRDRGVKKDRDRDLWSRSKRRRRSRGDRLSNREERGGDDDDDDDDDESSEESVNDDEEEDEGDDDGGGGAVTMLPPIAAAAVMMSNNHHHNRKSFENSKMFSLEKWKSADEMAIGFSVPRKARSVSTKRSPSSSNASLRKKTTIGPKLRQPKSTLKSSTSNPEELEIEIAEEELEIEIAEVLFGLKRQPQQQREPKSRVSSPISNSSSILQQNSTSSAATPLSAVAPKRKRPREVFDNLGISSTSIVKVEVDLPPKTEISSPNLENPESAAENGSIKHDFAGSRVVLSVVPPPPPPPPETATALLESKPAMEEASKSRDDNCEDASTIKANLNAKVSEIESQGEEKMEVDLMAPPLQPRLSPEKEGEIDFAAPLEQNPVVPNSDEEMRPVTKDNEERVINVEPEVKKAKVTAEEAELEKPVVSKERNIDLQLDLEKLERDTGSNGSLSGNKLYPHHVQKQPERKAPVDELLHTEKTAQSSSFPLPMSVASWPGGLPPMGYMAPVQGVVSTHGNTSSPTPMQPQFSQLRPKRCATHCYIAQNIHRLQQFIKMNPYWTAAAGSASLFGAKPCNLNVVPSTELHGNIAGRSMNLVQDKGQCLAIFPGHSGKDKSSQSVNIADEQRKQQILLQQALPAHGPPSNVLHGPAFVFPLNQQQTAVASVRPGSAQSPNAAGSVTLTNASNSASVSGSVAASPAATAASFHYQNMPASETYLAILQNNAYPFPITTIGAPPAYRGTHAQAMPFFNGSFYSSQMIHPSQLQQQQQPFTQPQQGQQVHQNTSISGGSSSSQKHSQSQQQRPQSSSSNGGNGKGNLHDSPIPRNQTSQVSQQQQLLNQHIPTSHQARHLETRHLETEVGGEDSPSTADSRVSRPAMSVYGQNYAVPFHPTNFAMMTPPSALASANCSGNQGEKNQQQQAKQQGLKAGGIESLSPQTFSMSFASMNGVTMVPGIDFSSMAQNHAVLRSLPEATRHSYQIIAAAAEAAQQKKSFQVSEEGKTGGGDSSNVDEEKKGVAGKAPVTTGKSITFSRPDLADMSVFTIPNTTVVDSSTRTLNLVSAPPRTSRSAIPNAVGSLNASNSQAQLQYQQNLMQLQQQQQHLAAASATRHKALATSNGNGNSDHLASSSPAIAKFPDAHSTFPHNFVQTSNPAPPPQWKDSARTTSQVLSSLASSTTSSLKNNTQQQARTQQSHTQISFGASQKSSTARQGQQAPTSHRGPSPPMMVGSPTTSSISKGASGSPRMTTSTSAGNKSSQAPALSSHQSKNSSSVPSQNSTPVGGRNVPSILGNIHMTSSSLPTAKPQIQQQQQLPKQTMQQPQLFFSGAYMQAQAPHSTTSASSTASATRGYYLQRQGSEQLQLVQQQQQQQHQHQQSQQQQHQHQQSQQPQGSSTKPSTGMLSLCPVALTTTSASDAKAVAAAAVAPHSTTSANSSAPATRGNYLQRRRSAQPQLLQQQQQQLQLLQQQQQQQQSQLPQGSSTSSAGMFSFCPVTLTTTSTSNASANNVKGSGLLSQGNLHPAQFATQPSGNSHQLVPFSYVHSIPAAVQVKPAELKQPAA